ncbi:MAG: phenylalanine--tRNA ligase subunit alpha [Alphaproteobacteria bacterium]|jgi:phenylalanyl-tRNA synthetase alpha chain|nr:phenylalanine--tRNA ligase subunit alpha [Alphaproteobacteria bacterium]
MGPRLQDWKQEINQCASLRDLEDIRIRLLGKSGEITQMLKNLGTLDADQRREKGAEINQLKEGVRLCLEDRHALLAAQALDDKLAGEAVDVTLSSRPEAVGTLHPLTRTLEEITAYFVNAGFSVAEGSDIEDEEHNFTALNIPEHHPARQSHDTFYLNAPGMLLRTHTSPVQIRTMKATPPPIRILSLGRVYRSDFDATHTPMFHQVEGLVIDQGTHMGHLKSCIIDFLRHYFDIADLPLRFRPSFFPFTEPSAEVDIGCSREGNALKIGTGKDWLEILGCGMVHPKVLLNCGIDPDIYQGFAFGMGLDRITMLKYGLPDIRPFFEGDARWLKHYGFSPYFPAGA